MNTEIALISGHVVNLAKPEGALFSLEDVCFGMAREPRYAGHTKTRWTVGQHVLLGLALRVRRFPVAHEGTPRDLWSRALSPTLACLLWLFHDAHEGIIGDWPQPLKNVLPEITQYENRWSARMHLLAGLKPPEGAEEAYIAAMDRYVLIVEMQALGYPLLPRVPREGLPPVGWPEIEDVQRIANMTEDEVGHALKAYAKELLPAGRYNGFMHPMP